jgi:type II protein arginine methyltransferase
LTNHKHYPVLSKRHQEILKGFMKFKVHVIIRGKPRHFECESLVPYFQYIRHLNSTVWSDFAASTSIGERECMAYNDTLQAPLQPLMDNLESQTYETFEQDPVKYAQYEEAVRRALLDMRKTLLSRQLRNPEESSAHRSEGSDFGSSDDGEQVVVVVMVVGAGRGPLVAASLSASTSSGVHVKVYAVEKNRNAVVTLRNRCKAEAWDNVEVVSCDMRKWNPAVKADIMISELLGSWGDNELSPECLDGAQSYLQDYGISIPQSYTSFIAPLTSAKLWNGAASIFPADKVKVLLSAYSLPDNAYCMCHSALRTP